jgi:hypothetical protein
MKEIKMKTAMVARMKTSRRQLDRLLDPKNPSVTLATLQRAASAVGRRLRVGLVSRFRSSHHFAAPSFANFGIEGH